MTTTLDGLTETLAVALAAVPGMGMGIAWAGVEITDTPFALVLPDGFRDTEPAGGNEAITNYTFSVYVGYPLTSKTGVAATPTDLSARSNTARRASKIVQPLRQFFAQNVGMCGGTTATTLLGARLIGFKYEDKDYLGPVCQVAVMASDSIDYEQGNDYS